jgi:HSP20 family protein
MFSRLLSPWWEETLPEETTGSYPVDIHEEDGKLVVDAELPGFTRDDVQVNLEGDTLTITAERKTSEREHGTEHLHERRYTRVQRSFTLPAPVDESKVTAKLQDGVLHLELEETEQAKPRRIEVK